MSDFSCKNAEDMYYKVLADKIRYYKEDAEGVEAMCQIMEDLIADEKRTIALQMLKDGKLSKEDIAKYLGLTVEKIEELAKSI